MTSAKITRFRASMVTRINHRNNQFYTCGRLQFSPCCEPFNDSFALYTQLINSLGTTVEISNVDHFTAEFLQREKEAW